MTPFEERMSFFDFVCHTTMNDKGSFNFSWDKDLGRIAYIEGSWQPVEVLNDLFNEHLKQIKMETKIKTASVKVMLSYDYSHFEASMSLENDNGLSMKEIDDARKDCQRLADKAVGQYKSAKASAAKRTDGEYKIANFDSQCKKILEKSEGDRTINEIAMLKQYQNENWQEQFYERYDYNDDENYGF
jgi:hypothetical protein